ncbi:MAG: imidazoleglycerol-phosphate dehydratase HisB [Verrucomicrobia bacterium]|nr:imidazoleglycerol-phosphate dehydratase HisB [Verrucomicrobiota bacterium]
MAAKRIAEIVRNTSETRIQLQLDLDGSGKSDINTGIPFFDHMLVLIARHGMMDLTVLAEGDIAVDYHHTVEDVGIVLGQAFKQALGDKLGIRRYGFFILPMDECLARVALDFGNRSYLVYDVLAREAYVRDFNIHLLREFFQGFANAAGANLHLKLEYGDEPHHIAEALCKCFARAVDAAIAVDPRQEGSLPSTKGLLT